MTVKVSSLLAILAIWAAMIPAIVAEPDAWWALIFAALATGAIGVSAWRRLGISRLIAIAGTWAAIAVAISGNEATAWMAIFGFLTTGAVVYSSMRRDAWLAGLGVGVAWAAVGLASVANDGEGTWICVFAFLTAGAIANSGGRGAVRGASAMLWWGIAGAVMVIGDGGWTFVLAIAAFLLTALALGFADFRLPTKLEWDLFDGEDSKDEIIEGEYFATSSRGRRGRDRTGTGDASWSGLPFDEPEDRGDAPPPVR